MSHLLAVLCSLAHSFAYLVSHSMYSVYVYMISANCRVCVCDRKHRGMYVHVLGDFQSCTQCERELCAVVAVLKAILGVLWYKFQKLFFKCRSTPVSLPWERLYSKLRNWLKSSRICLASIPPPHPPPPLPLSLDRVLWSGYALSTRQHSKIVTIGQCVVEKPWSNTLLSL